MAIQRLNLTQIKTEILRIVGVASSSVSDWETDANLYRIINMCGQQLSLRAAQAARPNLPHGKTQLRFDMYKTVSNASTVGSGLIVAASSSTLYMPVDFDHWISFYDTTYLRRIDVISDVAERHIKIKQKQSGPPEVIELMNFAANSSQWQRVGIVYPATPTGTAPAIELYYYRLPATMAGTDPDNEYPDCDPKYQYLWIYLPACEVMRPNNPSYDRYNSLGNELLIDLAATGTAY